MVFKKRPAMETALRDEIAGLVATELGLSTSDIIRGKKVSPWSVFARQLCYYLANVECGFTMSSIAAVFDRERSSIAYGIGQIEDLREAPAFELVIGRMVERLAVARARR